IRPAPARSHPLNQNVNLLVGKRASSLSRKGRRRSTRQSLRDHLAQRVVAHQSEIERIVQWPRCSQASPGAVTTGAVRGIELGKICYLGCCLPALFRGRLSRQLVTAGGQGENYQGH